jgi:hypothetical protein
MLAEITKGSIKRIDKGQDSIKAIANSVSKVLTEEMSKLAKDKDLAHERYVVAMTRQEPGNA